MTCFLSNMGIFHPMAGLLEGTLLETNISHLEKKKHRQKCFGRGYVSSLEGTVVLVFHFFVKTHLLSYSYIIFKWPPNVMDVMTQKSLLWSKLQAQGSTLSLEVQVDHLEKDREFTTSTLFLASLGILPASKNGNLTILTKTLWWK